MNCQGSASSDLEGLSINRFYLAVLYLLASVIQQRHSTKEVEKIALLPRTRRSRRIQHGPVTKSSTEGSTTRGCVDHLVVQYPGSQLPNQMRGPRSAAAFVFDMRMRISEDIRQPRIHSITTPEASHVEDVRVVEQPLHVRTLLLPIDKKAEHAAIHYHMRPVEAFLVSEELPPIECIIPSACTTGTAVLTYCYAYSVRVLREDASAHRIPSNPFDHLIFQFWKKDSFDHGIKLGGRSCQTNLRIRPT